VESRSQKVTTWRVTFVSKLSTFCKIHVTIVFVRYCLPGASKKMTEF
jgi:hypothetical protein